MNDSADRDRREAELLEHMAQSISLLPAKEALLAEARSLRRRADEAAGLSDCPEAIEQTLPSGGACD